MRILSGSPSYPDDHGSLGEAGTGPSSCVSQRMLFEKFPILCARAVRTWFIISVDLEPCSHCPLRLGVAVEYGKMDFTGDVYFRGCNAWFDSEYMLCSSTSVGMNELHTFSTLRQTRILKCCSPFCYRMEKSAQSMLVVAVLVLAVRIWKTEYFYELHVAETPDDGQHFWGTCVRHRCRESDSGLSGTHCQSDLRLLWTYTVTSVNIRLKQQQQQQQQSQKHQHQQHSVAILAQAATVVQSFLCQLVSVCGTSVNGVVPRVLSFVLGFWSRLWNSRPQFGSGPRNTVVTRVLRCGG